ncbi:methyl-accepting chemotaxis protein [Desertibacillus haloalkaliphilus]|uniref:methyl-accepting chemotaxis protein n=1 Tax=Desertibacillus haloalkaliphilus TaxID=1328930 RepID=UPI001C27CD24|nr:methyl-accepting chemotaxis protein [Desertibacillus haloalkaliphilus]MBU8908794.1 HAMP domain-containing protein [Desertibacillus haloalkaliphilus]
MKRIGSKLVTAIVLLLLVVTVALSTVSYLMSSNAVSEEAERALLYKAEDNARVIATEFEMRMSELAGVANRSEIVSMDWELQRGVLINERERLGYETLTFVDEQGIAHFDDGTTIDLSDREYVRTALAGTANVSDVLISRENNQPVVSIAAPITDRGEVLGALVSTVDGSYFSEAVQNISFGESGYAFIINESGVVMGHDNHQFVIDQVNMIEQSEVNPDLIPLANVMRGMIKGETGVAQYPFEGIERYMGYSPIEGTGWSIAVGAFEEEILEGLNSLQAFMVTLTIIVILVGAAIAYLLGRMISRPINEVAELGKILAKGDFTEDVSKSLLERKDEIGTLAYVFEQLTKSMRSMITKITESAEEVTNSAEKMNLSAEQSTEAANEVAASIQEVAQGSEGQVQSSNESARAMEEMATGVQKIAESSSSIAEFSNTTTEKAREGNEAAHLAVRQMDEIQKGTNATTEIINDLKQDSNEIGDIIQMITDISEQTNLLALNAAIEAARAGEAGKGFAVVADEIRKLADQTGKSAANINQLIEKIQVNIANAVSSMNEGKGEVDEGKSLITNVGDMFTDILKAIEDVAGQVEEMSAITEEMSASSEEVTASVEEMASTAEVSSQNSQQVAAASQEQLATMEDIQKASESVSGMAKELKDLVRQFKV